MDEPRTFGDLKALLDREPKGSWPSRCNPGMTHDQAIDVLRRGIEEYPDDAPLNTTRHGEIYRHNVLRECRSRRDDD